MATDYYRMGRDLGGAWFEGLERGRGIKRQEEMDRQRNELHDAQMQGLRRQRALEQEQDAAFREYLDVANNGIIDAAGTGLSQPSAQFIASGNAGFGTGERAVQEAAGMYQREMNRFAQAPAAPAGGLPKYDATAPVTRRAASEIEREQALGRVSAAQRDARGLRDSNERVTKLKFDEGYKGYADTLLTDMRALGPKGFIDKHGAALNANGNVDGYMTFDERSGKIAVATKTGVTLMDPADVLAYQLGAYKLGNGKVEEGIALMTGASDRNQKRIDSALDSARSLVTAQVKVWEAKQKDAREREQTAAYREVGLARVGASGGKGDKQVPAEIVERMQAIEVEYRKPDLTPQQRTILEREYNMLGLRAAHALGKVSGLRPGAALDEKSMIELAAAISKERGIPVPAAMAELRAVMGGQDPGASLIEKAKAAQAAAEGNSGAGLKVPQVENRIPPTPASIQADTRRQQQVEERQQQVDSVATEWDRVAQTVRLDQLDPRSARELLTRYGAYMTPAERMAINKRAN